MTKKLGDQTEAQRAAMLAMLINFHGTKLICGVPIALGVRLPLNRPEDTPTCEITCPHCKQYHTHTVAAYDGFQGHRVSHCSENGVGYYIVCVSPKGSGFEAVPRDIDYTEKERARVDAWYKTYAGSGRGISEEAR